MAYKSLELECEKCGKKERFDQEKQGDYPDVAGLAEESGWKWLDSTTTRCPKCAKRLRRYRTN